MSWSRLLACPDRLTSSLVMFVFVLLASGCQRSHYRIQADGLVHDVVAGATANQRFEVPDFNIAIDPRSRLFDPTDPDYPPMPPDDPDSNRLMQNVAGHRGYPRWHNDGDVPDVELSDYRAWLPYTEDGKVRVDLVGTVELARLHSRDYQGQLETLYLSALDVTAERFRFYSQFYGGNATEYSGVGAFANGGQSSSILDTTSNIRMQRAFTAGGNLAVGLANSIVWQFSGQGSTVNSSLANFAFSQPLLQFAGRPRIMEQLTRVERNLLANVRQFTRYRQGFYLDVVSGSGNTASLQRSGGLFGGSGLSGFTGVGVGGFGGVGAIGVTSSGNVAGGGGAGANGLGGYLGFLQRQQDLRNQRTRISALRNTWMQLNAAFDAGRLENRFQVDFAQQAYYTGQSQLLNNIAAYESGLDAYKMRLGLPPHIPLELKDPFFEQFNLINPELSHLQDVISDRMDLLSSAPAGEGPENPPTGDASTVVDLVARSQQFIEQITADRQRLEAALPARRQGLNELVRLADLQQIQFDNRALTLEALDRRLAALDSYQTRVTEELQELQQLSAQFARDDDLTADERIRVERELLSRLSAVMLEFSLLQARVRLHSITLVPITVTPENAFQLALTQRADWMNAKASLVDTWRLIRFNANALRTNLTVNVSGDMGTTGNNPIKFNGSNGHLNAGVTLDLPITRVIERNVYRQSLIDYQQARRSLMAQRDEIHRGLRARLRQIRVDQFNLELRRLAVDVAITQTDVARLKLVEPQKPVEAGKDPTASPTVARDLVDALATLQQSQFDLITVWGDYEMQRRLFDFDVGTMELDERGIWRDPGPVTDESVILKFYESMANPLTPADPSSQPGGFVELGPADLPPEPMDIDETPSPAK
ncbi:MAG: TolC family protein [Planctomycetes bacterium]|nr:TolC family protein [Planctomycetota bacterium]